MYGMSDYLMIAQAMEEARRLSRKHREEHRSKARANVGFSAGSAFTQRRKNRDE